MVWKKRVEEGLDHWLKICSNEQKYALIKDQIMNLRENVKDELTIMIAGEFNAGKSTFINALLGGKVLSSDVTPETAMVTKLTYGVQRKVIAHYLSGSSKVYDSTWLEQLTAEREGKLKAVRRTLSHVELQIPSEILKTFTIIDTPGLNANNEFHTKATERFFGKTDYVIFLFHAMNVGTATEIRWLKKFNEKGILPFGIINRIDELDEEEDELDELIEFSMPRLGSSIRELIGVSARDALSGKLSKDEGLLEWSNWSQVEQLLRKLNEGENPKLERVYDRLLEPIRCMDQIVLERKVSLPFKRLNSNQAMSFVTNDFPQLLAVREKIASQRNLNQHIQKSWNSVFKAVHTIDDLAEVVQRFTKHCEELKGQRGALLTNPTLHGWEETLRPQYSSFLQERKQYNTRIGKLREEQKELEQNWNDLSQSNMFSKKLKLERHEKRLALYSHERESLAKKQWELIKLFNEVKGRIGNIQKVLKDSASSHLQAYVENEKEGVTHWNKQLEYARSLYSQFSAKELADMESFSKWLHDFQRNVVEPLLEAGRSYENIFTYRQAGHLLNSLLELGHGLVSEELYSQKKVVDSLSKERARSYALQIPNLIPQEMMKHGVQTVPDLLQHNIQAEREALRAKRSEWLKGSIAVVLPLAICAAVYPAIQGSSEYNSDTSGYSSEYSEDETAATQVSDESQRLEERKEELEFRFPQNKIERFLNSVYQQLQYDQSRRYDVFNAAGWASFSAYYNDYVHTEQETLYITGVEYVSGNEIKVSVKESAAQSGTLKEFETEYTLQVDSSVDEDLVISAFSYKLISETETEIIIEAGAVSAFLTDFRSAYIQSLNRKEFSSISHFLLEDGPAFQELQTYITSITDKDYGFEEMGFQVTSVEKAGVNEYRAITSETFMFIDERKNKTKYERTKSYSVKVLSDKTLVLKEMMTTNTKKTPILTPTVQLVTNEDVDGFMHKYYVALEEAFNGSGFSRVQSYYDPEGSGYSNAEIYIKNANNKRMRMNNLELHIESLRQADENHYLVVVKFVDEYAYQDGSGDRKVVRGQYKVRVANTGNMSISEDPEIEILEETEY